MTEVWVIVARYMHVGWKRRGAAGARCAKGADLADPSCEREGGTDPLAADIPSWRFTSSPKLSTHMHFSFWS